MPATPRLAIDIEEAEDTIRRQMAVNNFDDHIPRHRVIRDVDHALVELAANLIRVIRGTGRPHAVGLQARALSDAMESYRDAVGLWPSGEEIAGRLRLDATPEWLSQVSPMEQGKWLAKQAVIKGSLQIAASSLLGQRVQRAAGHSQMYQGLAEIEEIRARERAELERGEGETQRSQEPKKRRRPAT